MNSGQAGVLIPWPQIKSPGGNLVNQGAEIWHNVDLFWAKTTVYYQVSGNGLAKMEMLISAKQESQMIKTSAIYSPPGDGCELEITMTMKLLKPKDSSLNRSSAHGISLAPVPVQLWQASYFCKWTSTVIVICTLNKRIKRNGEREREECEREKMEARCRNTET